MNMSRKNRVVVDSDSGKKTRFVLKRNGNVKRKNVLPARMKNAGCGKKKKQ